MRRSFLTLRCPSHAYSTPHQITQHQILSSPLMPRGQLLLPSSAKDHLLHKCTKTPQENCVLLTPLFVGGRLCDEFCCGDFCICYSGCFFRVKTKVVSRMALCGIWWRRGEPPLCKGRWIAKQDGGIVRKGVAAWRMLNGRGNPSPTIVVAP